MSKNKGKEEVEFTDVLESPEGLADQLSKFEESIEKNKNVIIGVIGAIILVVAGVVGYNYYNTTQNNEAQNQMYNAIYYFESDSLNKAMNGDGNNLGFKDIASEYSGTKAGSLASFYAGVISMNQGNLDAAIDYLGKYKGGDIILQARAYCLIGDAYSDKGNYSDAISYYKKAADHNDDKYFTPVYLMKLGMAYEATKDYSSASDTYNKIIKKYPDFADINDAKKLQAKAETLKKLI
jgi:tetratricopeptide (TPR) repeat protein